MIGSTLLIISLTILLIVQTYRYSVLQGESDSHFESQEEYIKQILEDLGEFKSQIPPGTQNPLCDRWNPFHNTAMWYLEECEKDITQFTLEEHAHYRSIVKTEEKYQLYRKQPLQGYRNNSVIWEKGWCDKWSDGLGPYGLGHDHWIPGRFQYEYENNQEFATWLDQQG